jgi:hypothetical protein
MPKVSTVQTNFTAGEWSPNMLGRTDVAAYNNAAETLENVIVLPQGGARRRPGQRFVAAAKFAAKRARLMPFVFSETDAYVLEVGDLYMRFYKNSARLGAPYEIVTPYTEAMLDFVDYVQGADTMILAHQAVPTQRLRRFADTNWQIDAVPFEISPFDEIGHSFSASLTLSAATVGAARTVTASSGIFLNGDVGRQIVYQGGVLLITVFTDALHVTGDITSAFGSVNVPTDVWTLDGSPQESITPNAKDPLETTITLTSAALNIWRAADVGKFVRINGGIVKITVFTSPLVVSGVIKQVLSAVTAAPKNSWSLEATVWSAGNGYPQAVTLNGQRLILGGSLAYPQTAWGSSVGAYFDFLLGVNDADAFAYTLTSDQINPILHFASGKTLFAFTYGGEFTIRGGVEKPITPTNVQVKNDTAYGSGVIRPLRAGKQNLFVDQSYLQLLSYNYDASEDDFDADDLTLLADHISGDGFVDLSYQRTPVPLVYAPREDGQCPTLTLHEKQQVAAWSRQITDGIVESVATIPIAGGHQTWVLVARVVNGATVRYIEVFDSAVACDSALTGTSGAGQATWTAAHLKGKTIQCVADGRYMGTFTADPVTGNFTLPRVAFEVMYGLPYSCRIKILTPEIQTGEGTAQGNAMSTHEVAINFLQSYSCKVNGREVPFRKLGVTLLDQALTPFTGYKKIENLGWATGQSDIEITSEIPLPFHVRAIVRKWTVNAG